MTHRINRECNHECDGCDLADPALCKDWAEMTAEHHTVRYCKHCDEMAWHEETVFSDGSGNGVRTSVWLCPRCRRVFG